MIKLTVLLLTSILFVSGCASNVNRITPEPAQVQASANQQLTTLPAPEGGAIVAAVYGFADLTGQRKPSDRVAHISTAVTQGADVLVVKALKEAGDGTWFRVVERRGLEHLARERQIIRQSRESVNDTTQLSPLMFAGVIIEGGIIGYDSNVVTGGSGARYLGIGAHVEYREDIITVAMRVVSVQTGEVLLAVTTTKTVISVRMQTGIFRFVESGTQAVEAELGNSQNEPVSYAVKLAVEEAVLEIINQGIAKDYWAFAISNEEPKGEENEGITCKSIQQIDCDNDSSTCTRHIVECEDTGQ